MNRKYFTIFLAILIGLTLSGCMNQSDIDSGYIAGFWFSFWNGIIAPWSFLGSLFFENILVYATVNKGGLYDFGFLLGIGAFASSASTAASNSH